MTDPDVAEKVRVHATTEGDNRNNKSLKTIAELEGDTFIVKPYQRGYKWEKQQVRDLLNDIWDFKAEINENNKKVYCLQPIVVLKEKEHRYELIDGQQRITTIYIILSYLGGCNYCIEYETRSESHEFLENKIRKDNQTLLDYKDTNSVKAWESFIKNNSFSDNMDIYHFVCAYCEIDKWFNEDNNEHEKDKFKELLLNQVGVLWYEPWNEEDKKSGDVNKIFRNVNSGKIPLTNAELIKAYILISKKDHDEQMLIAREWDAMEIMLQHDDFWYFLNPKKSYINRIELLFMLWSLTKDESKQRDGNAEDQYSLFRKVQEYCKTSPESSLWNEIKKIYNTLEEWYSTDEMFHLLGYIRATKLKEINILLSDWKKTTKNDFLKKVKTVIIEKVILKKELDKLDYSENNNRSEISNILLLHNILSLRQKSGDNDISSNARLLGHKYETRFRFDLYSKEKWTLEHIHAQKERQNTDPEQMKKDVESTLNHYKRIKQLSQEDEEKYKSFLLSDSSLEEHYKEYVDWAKTKESEDESIHKIGNLALLSGDINTSISNGYFDEKRDKIIEFDKEGRYILPATKNVFLKYYSAEIDNVYEWTRLDKENYKKNIENTLHNFMEEVKEIKDGIK